MSLEMSEDLLVNEPERIADAVVKKKNPTDTQMRKFYDDFMLLKRRIDNIYNLSEDEVKGNESSTEDEKNERFLKEIKPLIMFTKVKMAYSVGRSGKAGYLDFYKEVTDKLSKIESRSDFELFLKFYEAIISFVKFKTFENSLEKNEKKGTFKK